MNIKTYCRECGKKTIIKIWLTQWLEWHILHTKRSRPLCWIHYINEDEMRYKRRRIE